jgi:hypothetical protein
MGVSVKKTTLHAECKALLEEPDKPVRVHTVTSKRKDKDEKVRYRLIAVDYPEEDN